MSQGEMNQEQQEPSGRSVWDEVCSRLPQQHWPAPALYVVATPIGNLADFSPRAWFALSRADVIAAEDTRSTRVLLDAWRIQAELLSVHRHNERDRLQQILERLSQGQKVALVSDAGAPGVSDPGGVLIQAVREHGYPVVGIPGPSAVIATLMSFGTTTDEQPGFTFLGFLPQKSGQRRKLLEQWSSYSGTIICFEAPHRLQSSLKDMLEVFGSERQIGLARELTKRFEQTVMMTMESAVQWVNSDRHHLQGEYVLLIPSSQSGSSRRQDVDESGVSLQAWAKALLEHVSTRDAAKVMSKATGKSRDECYALLLEISAHRDRGHDAD